MTLFADYYDGKSSARQRVALSCDNGALRLRGESIDRRAALAELRLSEPMGSAPRLITFPEGDFCEVRDHAGFQALLDETGFRDRRIVRWQGSLRWIIASSLLCLFCLFAGYRWGLPVAAERLAWALPESVLETISDQLLEQLDARLLGPSELLPERQVALARRFAALSVSAAPMGERRVIFRANRALSANALALPSGTLILTDDLVALAGNDNQLMAVLAHELGHVELRHGMRQIIQSTAVGLLAAWLIGDVSSLMAAAPAALLEAKYSRAFEQEADAYAVRLLAANGLSPRCLAELLLRLEENAASARSGQGRSGSDYLSSHPETAQRSAAMAGARCEPAPD